MTDHSHIEKALSDLAADMPKMTPSQSKIGKLLEHVPVVGLVIGVVRVLRAPGAHFRTYRTLATMGLSNMKLFTILGSGLLMTAVLVFVAAIFTDFMRPDVIGAFVTIVFVGLLMIALGELLRFVATIIGTARQRNPKWDGLRNTNLNGQKGLTGNIFTPKR